MNHRKRLFEDLFELIKIKSPDRDAYLQSIATLTRNFDQLMRVIRVLAMSGEQIYFLSLLTKTLGTIVKNKEQYNELKASCPNEMWKNRGETFDEFVLSSLKEGAWTSTDIFINGFVNLDMINRLAGMSKRRMCDDLWSNRTGYNEKPFGIICIDWLFEICTRVSEQDCKTLLTVLDRDLLGLYYREIELSPYSYCVFI